MDDKKYLIERNGIQYSVLDGFKIKDCFEKIKDVESILLKGDSLSSTPIVSILIPTYKRVETLKETLQSCFNQKTDIPFNIIIIDSNGERNDTTEQYVKSLTDPRIKYYKYSRSVSAIDNRNRSFELCDGEYSLMVHDDDILYPDFIQTMVGLMQQYPQIDILYPNRDNWYQFEGQECPYARETGKRHLYRLTTCDFADTNEGFTTGFVAKKSTILAIGGWDETYSPSSDWVFNVKAIVNKVGVYKYNQYMFAYRFAENDTRNVKTRIRFLETNPQVISAICKYNVISLLFRPCILSDYYRWEVQEIKRMIPNLDGCPQEKQKLESLIPKEYTSSCSKTNKYALKLWRNWLKCLRVCNRIY